MVADKSSIGFADSIFEKGSGIGEFLFTVFVAMLAALGRLPEKYRTVMTLYYVEEMSIRDISGVIKRTESAVKMRLKKGRELLRTEYEKELRK